jgi:hypothetical protein
MPVAERLAAIAKCHAAVLQATGSSVRDTLRALGGEFLAPHLDEGRIAAATSAVPAELREHLLAQARDGITPPLVARDASMDSERWRRATRPVQDPASLAELLRQALARVDKGHALVLPRDRGRQLLSAALAPRGQQAAVVSPSYTIPKSTPGEFRVITDLKYCAGQRRLDSVNAATNYDVGPKCVFGDALKRVLTDIYAAKQRAPNEPVYVWVCDVADAFRQMYFNPDYAPLFCTVVGDFLIVELRGVFGWRLTPGEFDVCAQALRCLVKTTPPRAASASQAAQELALRHVRVEDPPPDVPAAVVPRDEAALTPPLAADAAADIHHHVDDGAVVEQRRRLLLAIAAVVIEAHIQLFGYDPTLRQCPVSLKKLAKTPWTTRASFLGLILDTHRFTLELPADKQARLSELCFQLWPASRTRATVHDLESLIGELRFVAMCVAIGKFFLWRLTARLTAVKRGGTGVARLQQEFHNDLDWWRFLVEHVQHMATPLSCPLWAHVKVPPHLVAASDASRKGLGGCCEPQLGCLGWWWALMLPPDLQLRYNAAGADDAVWVNEVELAGMVINAWVALVVMRQLVGAACLLLLGDNTSAVAWIAKCGTARNPTAGTLVRVLGVLSVVTEVSFKAQHVAGKDNGIPDAISRFLVGKLMADGSSAPAPPAAWLQVTLPPELCENVLGALRGSCSLAPWLANLRAAMPQLGGAALAGAPSGAAAPSPSS